MTNNRTASIIRDKNRGKSSKQNFLKFAESNRKEPSMAAKKNYEMKEMTIEQMENFASENNLKVKDTDDETRYDLYDGRKKMYEVTIVEEAKKKQVHVRTGETLKAWSGKDSKGVAYKVIYRKSKDRAELWKAEKDEAGKLHRNRIINKDIEQTTEAYQKFAESLIAEADGKKVAPKRKTKTA